MFGDGAVESLKIGARQYLSPAHALLIGAYGVSARLLINGSSIRQVDEMEGIEYFHIELDSHDGMFAEGLPVETYFEADNRQAYDNAAEYEALYPGDDPRIQEPCAKIDIPLAALNRIRANLAKRAERDGPRRSGLSRRKTRG